MSSKSGEHTSAQTPGELTPGANQASAELRAYLKSAELEFEEPTTGTFAITVPGEHRLKTTVSIVISPHGASLNAFIVRNPDENHTTVYRWLLERNRRIYALAYAADQFGDIYLVGKFPHSSINATELDRIFGSVAENSDGMFDHLLELGFKTSIQREWKWRLSRGESTRNLAAFTHLKPSDTDGDGNTNANGTATNEALTTDGSWDSVPDKPTN